MTAIYDRRTYDDDPGSVLPTGGTGGIPATIAPLTATITWDFQDSMVPFITGFDVILYAGSDPTDNSAIIFLINVNPTVRSLVKVFYPKASYGTTNAAVRAVYA